MSAEKQAICAGGTDADISRTLVHVYASGPGVQVGLTVAGGTHQLAPEFAQTTLITDTMGRASTWLTSGDLVEALTITAQAVGGSPSSCTVNQEAPALEFTPTSPETGVPATELVANGESCVNLPAHTYYAGGGCSGYGPVEGHELEWSYRIWEAGTDRATEPPDFVGASDPIDGTVSPTTGTTESSGACSTMTQYRVGVAPGKIEFVLTDWTVFQRDTTGQIVPVAAREGMPLKYIKIDLTPDHPTVLPQTQPAKYDVWDRVLLRTRDLDTHAGRGNIRLTCKVPGGYRLNTTPNRVQGQETVTVTTRATDGYAQIFFFPSNIVNDNVPITVEYEWRPAMNNKPAKKQVETVNLRVVRDPGDNGSNDPHWWNRAWPAMPPIQLTWSGNALATDVNKDHITDIQTAILAWNAAQNKVQIAVEPVAAGGNIQINWTELMASTATGGETFLMAPYPHSPALPPGHPRGPIQSATIAMNVGTQAAGNWIRWNIVHELGHAMGLNHNMVQAGSIMASPHWTNTVPTTPRPNDVGAILELYGP